MKLNLKNSTIADEATAYTTNMSFCIRYVNVNLGYVIATVNYEAFIWDSIEHTPLHHTPSC